MLRLWLVGEAREALAGSKFHLGWLILELGGSFDGFRDRMLIMRCDLKPKARNRQH